VTKNARTCRAAGSPDQPCHRSRVHPVAATDLVAQEPARVREPMLVKTPFLSPLAHHLATPLARHDVVAVFRHVRAHAVAPRQPKATPLPVARCPAPPWPRTPRHLYPDLPGLAQSCRLARPHTSRRGHATTRTASLTLYPASPQTWWTSARMWCRAATLPTHAGKSSNTWSTP
jgi:hypothetical protein